MKKINFSAIEVKNIDGTTGTLNIKRDFANALYVNSKEIEGNALGLKIYNAEGEVELNEQEEKIVKDYVAQFYPSYLIQTAIINSIK
jgi:hypothetical protein